MENGIPQPSTAADADVGTGNPTDQQVDKVCQHLPLGNSSVQCRKDLRERARGWAASQEAMQRRVEIKKQQALAVRNRKKREREQARELAEEAADLAEAEAWAEPPSMDGEACCEALALRPAPANSPADYPAACCSAGGAPKHPCDAPPHQNLRSQ